MKYLIIIMLLCSSPAAWAVPRLALFDLVDGKGQPSEEGANFTLILLTAMSSIDSIELIERKEMFRIMQERNLLESGLTEQQYRDLADILRADYLVTGRIYRTDGEKMINIKMVHCLRGDVFGRAFCVAKDGDVEALAKIITDFISSKIIKKEESLSQYP